MRLHKPSNLREILSRQLRYITFLLLLTVLFIPIAIGNAYARGRFGIGIFLSPIFIYLSADMLNNRRYILGIVLFVVAIVVSQF